MEKKELTPYQTFYKQKFLEIKCQAEFKNLKGPDFSRIISRIWRDIQ